MKRANATTSTNSMRPANPLLQGGTPGDTMRAVADVLHFLRSSSFDLEADEEARGLERIIECCTDALEFELSRNSLVPQGEGHGR
jgi:hypothetical protein